MVKRQKYPLSLQYPFLILLYSVSCWLERGQRAQAGERPARGAQEQAAGVASVQARASPRRAARRGLEGGGGDCVGRRRPGDWGGHVQDRALCRDLLPHGISHLFSLATKERPPFPIQVPISPFNPSMLLSSNRQAKWLHLLRSGISEQSKQAECISLACFNFSHRQALNPPPKLMGT